MKVTIELEGPWAINPTATPIATVLEDVAGQMRKTGQFWGSVKYSLISPEDFVINWRVTAKQSWEREHDQMQLCNRPGCHHAYYRHFDTYEDMVAVGCKYCVCHEFVDVI